MPGEIFYWVLNISILGSAVGLIPLLLRRIRALPRFGVYLLWILPFLRLLIPAGFANRYSLLSFISQYTTKTLLLWEPASELPEITTSNFLQAATQYSPIEYKTDLLKNIFSISGLIWLIIAVAAILCSIFLYINTKSALKDAQKIRDNIYLSDKILSPAVYGIIRPQIILPENITNADLEYILRHEQIHIRRKDNLWRILAVLTGCIHWFNPLVWIFIKCFFIDMELACDHGVIKNLTEDDQKSYASALLSYSAGKSFYASAFGGAKTRLRIENILSYKKLTLASCIFFIVLFIVITVTVITNAPM